MFSEFGQAQSVARERPPILVVFTVDRVATTVGEIATHQGNANPVLMEKRQPVRLDYEY